MFIMRARIDITAYALALVGLLVFGLSAVASAQIDPSSALLLNQGDRRAITDPAVDSGRYKVVPRSGPTSRRSQAVDSGGQEPSETAPPPGSTPAPSVSQPASSPSPAVVSEESSQANSEERRADVGPRDGLLEIRVSPGFVYNDSDSAYFYRRYHSAAAAIAAEANVWLLPSAGLSLGYLGTVGGHVGDSLNGSKNVPAHQEWFTIGIRTKNTPENGDGGAKHSFGFDYVDYQFRVAGSSVFRQKLATTGVRLSMETEIPVNQMRSWTFGLSFSPKLQHRELRSSGVPKSGPGADASSLGFSVGGEIRLDPDSSMFWQVSHSFEKDLFSGSATAADPISGLTPSGVSVMNSFTLFRFGYRWGR
jgi:hypothetical protein